ncbi:ABC transporter substrate-binding protein [Kiloniella laminariae]|uniref:ABC transporter substrate-binding protein n=1 Tax=Kiloniella laminariae TaxID=454162 RepID=UPI00036853BE|nr:ABC transporter substrate-binding protein [Kiloniella laminariae]
MKEINTFELSRRSALKGAAALGAAGLLLPTAAKAETPKKGGTLRMGLAGGASSDTLDPAKFTDHFPVTLGYQLRNLLVEVDTHGAAIPELAESWSANPDAKEWTFKIRQGVEFHNGKTLDADDVIFSLNHHRGEKSESGAKTYGDQMADIVKTGSHEIMIKLHDGNADLPFLLSDYHFMIAPAGTTNWDEGIGTGPFILEEFIPGTSSRVRKNPNYWKEGRAHVDAVEMLVINDVQARISALLTKQVHLINKIDPKTVGLLKRNKELQLLLTKGGQHYPFLMNTSAEPYSNLDLRLAVKYAVDREQMVKTVLRGYGTVGNDHPIPQSDFFHAADLPQRAYDPDKAAFHFKKAGMDGQALTLHTSEAAFSGAVDSAVLLKESAAKAGITVDVAREPADGYWSNVWMKKPFAVSYWSGRPTADLMLSVAYHSQAEWNDTYWKNEQFDQLLVAARSELDDTKRRGMYHDLQMMVSDDGGAMIPMFVDFIDAGLSSVKGYEPRKTGYLSGDRAAEVVWLEE